MTAPRSIVAIWFAILTLAGCDADRPLAPSITSVRTSDVPVVTSPPTPPQRRPRDVAEPADTTTARSPSPELTTPRSRTAASSSAAGATPGGSP